MNSLFAKLSAALLLVVALIGGGFFLVEQVSTRLYYEEITQRLNASIAMYVTGERQRRGRSCQGHRSRIEGFSFESAHRAIPNQRTTCLQDVSQGFNSLRTDIKNHLIFRHLVNVAGAQGCRIGGKLFRHHNVIGQMYRAAGVIGFVHDCVCSVSQIMFAKRFANIHPARSKEGIRHPASDNEVLNAPNQILKNGELG